MLPAESEWCIIITSMWALILMSDNWFLGTFLYQGCNCFIYRYRLIIFGIKVCYQQTVSDVSSWPPCGIWFYCQIIVFWGHFCIRNVTFFNLLIYIYYPWYEGGLSSGSVTHIIMPFMVHWPLISTSNNGYKFRS